MRKLSLLIGVLLAMFSTNRIYSAEITPVAENNKVFGQEFLNIKLADKTVSGLNIDSGPVGVLPDYILKPQDEVNIDIWGSLNLHYSLTIGSDGYIVIPETGRVSLNGLTYSEGKKKILNNLAYTYAFFIDAENPGAGKAQVDITLGKTAGINVFVTGEVKNPGNVNINGINASIINVLKKAGINGHASIRNIELKKLNGKTYNFDLYDFILKGNFQAEFKYLNDGDIVFVLLRGKEVSVTGSVRRPGVYELLASEKLNDALRIAGGVLSGSQKEIKIFRENYNASGENVDEVNTTIESDCVLKDKDVIVIPGSSEVSKQYYVTVSGEVKRPGNYVYLKYEKVNDLIKRCGGLNNGASLECTEFYRNGAIAIVDFEKAVSEPESRFNFDLLAGDKIIIPKVDSFVAVRGEVLSPSSVFFKQGESADYYIKMSGGYKDNADKENVSFTTPGGVIKNAHKGFWSGLWSSNPAIPSGATIKVPARTN